MQWLGHSYASLLRVDPLSQVRRKSASIKGRSNIVVVGQKGNDR